MDKPDICVNFNSVFIEDQEVKRPKNFSVQAWFLFWETAESFDMNELVEARKEIRNLNAEITELKHLLKDCRKQVNDNKPL
jgi:hypothetical protein